MKKNLKTSILVLLILILTNCYNYKLKIDNEIYDLNDLTHNKINQELENDSPEFDNKDKQIKIEETLKKPISRNEAISIALLNNKVLQTAFEDIGVTKADLVQSGLLSNPEITTFNYIIPLTQRNLGGGPKRIPDIQLQPLMTLSDFWQIPFGIQVQKDQLQLTIFSVFDLIINIIKSTRKAYDNLLFVQNQLKLTKEIYKEVKGHLNEMKNKKEENINDIKLILFKFKAQKISYQAKGKAALAELKNALGLEDYYLNIEIKDKINYFHKQLDPVDKLIKYAAEYRPDILIAKKKIELQEDALRYERSRSYKELKGGFWYERTPDNNQWLGPSLTTKIPYFDYNQAQIAKAKYLLSKAKKELVAKRIKAKTEVYQAYVNYEAYLRQVEIYDTEIVPANEKIIKNILKLHESSEGGSEISLLQTETPIFETRYFLLDLYHNTLDGFTDLENSVGKRLDISLPDSNYQDLEFDPCQNIEINKDCPN